MNARMLWLTLNLFLLCLTRGSEVGQNNYLDRLKDRFSQIKEDDPIENKIEKLGNILRWIESPELHPGRIEEARAFQKEVQNEIITIPGHAEFFAIKIREEQGRVKGIPLQSVPGRNEYNKNRYIYISKVLANIPSPETIRVLGEFLWDDKDNHPRGPNDDWGPIESNGNLAGLALSQIGLRNPPMENVFLGSPTEFNNWRAWYEEIKSGKRAFSFKGQNVEYRFNSDGSVSTTPIKVEEERPAPAPRKLEAVERQQPTAQAPTSTPAPVVEPTRRLWIIVGLLVTALIATGAIWRKGKKSH
jgi:hypothetical protein